MAVRTASPASPRGLVSPRGGARRARPAPGAADALAGVRWDRLGRVALLFVLAALLYLYLSAGVRLLEKWAQAGRDRAAVAALQREHTMLKRQHETLSRQATLEAEARRLGMIKPGEQPFIAGGLPNN